MKESSLRLKAKELALKIINVCDTVDNRNSKTVIINQIIRSSTSIGANIHEANYAASKADFINKLHIALKECFETEYWLELMRDSDFISDEVSKNLINCCGTIRKLLVTSINTSKNNKP